MADSGGHWLNLAELQRLSQSELLAGVIDEAPKRGGLLGILPISQSTGLSTKWNRSNARRSATRIAIGTQLTWSDNITYTPVESTLKIFYDQTPLNKFVREVYGTINNYEAQQMLELRTGVIETLEDALIYDDVDYNDLHITGLHHWAVDNTTTDGDLDEAESALQLINYRISLDYMKYGVDFSLMSYTLARYIAAMYQEGALTTNFLLGSVIWSPQQVGAPIPIWGGTPIMRSDYMLPETANVGQGSDARASDASLNNFSMFLIKQGNGMSQNDPGINYRFGGDTHANGEPFRVERFDKLEDFDAAGLRLTNYSTLTCGSTLGIARITDITGATPTA